MYNCSVVLELLCLQDKQVISDAMVQAHYQERYAQLGVRLNEERFRNNEVS